MSDLMDVKNSVTKKIMNEDKPDPGTFSLMEPGWWAFHAVAIGSIYMLGHKIGKSFKNNY